MVSIQHCMMLRCMACWFNALIYYSLITTRVQPWFLWILFYFYLFLPSLCLMTQKLHLLLYSFQYLRFYSFYPVYFISCSGWVISTILSLSLLVIFFVSFILLLSPYTEFLLWLSYLVCSYKIFIWLFYKSSVSLLRLRFFIGFKHVHGCSLKQFCGVCFKIQFR